MFGQCSEDGLFKTFGPRSHLQLAELGGRGHVYDSFQASGRRAMRKYLQLVGMVLTCAGASTMANASDPSCDALCKKTVGTWHLNLKESIAPQGTSFDPYEVVVRKAGAYEDFSYTSTSPDGKQFKFSYNAPTDGVIRDLGSGVKGTMILLPDGSIEARLWLPDGSYENKFCQLDASLRKVICLATVTEADGYVVFFKQVLDKQ
jgi:hypothetical protein